MSTEYSGKGDPRRTLALLWRNVKSPTRGPKPAMSIEAIVEAAITIADRQGLAALSMRRVAEQLNAGTMSLYTYVPGKAELLDLMLDQVLGEIQLDGCAPGAWRAALGQRARLDWELYRRHPWLLQISGARPPLGPNATEVFEQTARAIWGIGLQAGEVVAVINLVAGYVRGAAQGALEAALAQQQTGQSDDTWWAAHEPVLDQYFDPQRFPTLISLSRAGAFDAVPGDDTDYLLRKALDDFAFGLERVLDGVEALVQQRAAAN